MVEQLRRHRDHERRPTGLDPAGRSALTAWYVWTLFGNPQEGSFDIAVKVRAATEIITEIITVNWNSSESNIQTALATHSLIAFEQVVTSTTGGLFPQSEIKFRFTGGLTVEDVTFPTHADVSGLAGGFNMHLLIRKVNC